MNAGGRSIKDRTRKGTSNEATKRVLRLLRTIPPSGVKVEIEEGGVGVKFWSRAKEEED